jgi:peptidoglycan/xylan/chitin deacetylase (PgdA/CDA1 family)
MVCCDCETEWGRRHFIAGGLTLGALPGAFIAQAATGLVEPVLRLANIAPGERTVALTLDACPGAFDWRIADRLLEHEIAATILVTGLWIRRNRAAVDFLRARPDLFAIENHGARHVPPVLGERTVFGIEAAGDLGAVSREVSGGAAAIEAAFGTRPGWYRGAAGLYSPVAIPAIEAMGFRIAGFSLNGDVGASLPAAAVAARIARARNGDVIVSHINQPLRPSGQGVADGVAELKRQGVRFVHLPT